MKIVFVVSSTYGGERLGVQILISIAKGEGLDVFFYALDSMREENLLNRIDGIRPDIVAYSAMSYEHRSLQNFNQKLKERFSFISIFGGPHYTFCPEEMDSDEYVDVVCVGEGEVAFSSFLKHLKDKTDYTRVKNLFVRHNKGVYKNPVGPLIARLDEVPFADRKTIWVNEEGHRFSGRTCYLMISRGCPYLCTYCFNSIYSGIYKTTSPHKIRWRSIPNVIAEMKEIKQETRIDYFSILDDTFNLLPRDYIHEFCRVYKKEISIPFSVGLRADLVDEELVRALKEAGVNCVYCGIECGDEEVSRNILKRGLTNEQICNAFQIINRHEIESYSQNLLGLPVENPVEVALNTIKLNIECKPTYAHFSLLLPLPKTPIERYCRENGYLPKGNGNNGLLPSVHIRSILKFRTKKDNWQIDNLHKFASIVVRYPFLLPFVKLLINLPPNRLFQHIYFLWYGYNRTIVLHGVKWSPGLIFEGIKQIRGYLQRHA